MGCAVSRPSISSFSSFLDTGLGDFTFSEWMSRVTMIPGPCNGNSISSPPWSKLSRPYCVPLMCVLTPLSTGEGISGSSLLLEFFAFPLPVFHDVGALSAGVRYFVVWCATNRALNAVKDTTIIATAASVSYQNRTQELSTPPLLVSPPATFMMEVIIVQTLRQRMPPRASLRRMLIWTFQRRRTGIEMTNPFVNIIDVSITDCDH